VILLDHFVGLRAMELFRRDRYSVTVPRLLRAATTGRTTAI